jgi:hypothetical protein
VVPAVFTYVDDMGTLVRRWRGRDPGVQQEA